MEIREDFNSVNDYLQRLIKYAEVFEKNNFEYWPHLKHKEDFQSIYELSREDRAPLEKIYSVGRDCAVSMSDRLRSFNNADEHPTLAAFVTSFEGGWIYQIDDLRLISENAKDKMKSLKYRPWAVEQMIVLFDEQLKLLEASKETLNILKKTDLYKIETGELQPGQRPGWLKKIWRDPVWSKVISAAIIFFVSSAAGYFLYSKSNDKHRLKEALRSLDAIQSHVEISIETEPDEYLSFLERARADIKNTINIKGKVHDLILKTYDCYHEAGELWADSSPTMLQKKGSFSTYEGAMKQFQKGTLPKLTVKWKECSGYLKKAYEYFEME